MIKLKTDSEICAYLVSIRQRLDALADETQTAINGEKGTVLDDGVATHTKAHNLNLAHVEDAIINIAGTVDALDETIRLFIGDTKE